VSAAEAIRGELDSNERLLWADQPAQGVRLRGSDAFMIPFSLLWCGFVVFWEYSVIQGGAPLFFMLWGIPFVAMGLYIVVGRFFVDARQRASTYYGLSDERVIIVSGLFHKRVRSLSLRTLADVWLAEGASEIGTISFGNAGPFGGWFNIGGWPGAGQLTGSRLELVANAKQVFQRIREAQRHAG
jgi:hypothetical protein